jgi:hypothetical protein
LFFSFSSHSYYFLHRKKQLLFEIKPPDEGADEDAPPVIVSKWICHKTQKLSDMYDHIGDDVKSQVNDEPEGQPINNFYHVSSFFILNIFCFVSINIENALINEQQGKNF